jgi:ribonuclease HI
MKQVYTDGAVRLGNPGLCSAAYVVYNDDGTTCFEHSRVLYDGLHTNNEAEYAALIDFLTWATTNGVSNTIIHCDSQLVVEQVNQRAACNFDHLKPKMALAYGLLVRGRHVLRHIKGHAGYVGNERADQLCNEALDKWSNDPKNMPKFMTFVTDTGKGK